MPNCYGKLGLLVALFLCLMPNLVVAQSKSHTVTLPLKTTDWSASISVPKHPTGSGTLTKVEITMQSSINGTLSVESLDSSSGAVTSTLSAEIKLRRPDNSVIMTHTPGVSKTDTFTAFDGVTDYAGDSGAVHLIATTATETDALNPISVSDIALFTGNGSITLPITAEAVSSFAGGGNLDSIATLSASAITTVTYTYVSPDLKITVSSDDTFTIGQSDAFTITVENVGTGPTTDTVTVTDTIPSGLTPTSAQGDGWDCTVSLQTVSCTHDGPVTAGATLPDITVSVTVGNPSFPSVVNTAAVSTDGDTNASNGSNASSVTTTVQQAPAGTGGGSVGSGAGGTTTTSGTGGAGGAGGIGGAAGGGGTPNTSPSGGGVANTQGAFGGPIQETEAFAFTNDQGAFGGPQAGNENPVIDATGCPVDDELTIPINLDEFQECFVFDPGRPITFSDTSQNPRAPYIEVLKKTKIQETGDYIVSGTGNHSTGGDPDFSEGEFPFEPDRQSTRFEVAKLALISNCISISENIPDTDVIFSDVQNVHSTDPAQDFITRVLYTAVKHGVMYGYGDGTARPHQRASNAEILAVLLRASHAFPRGLEAMSQNNWFDTYVVFAKENHIVPQSFDPDGSMNRAELSELLVHVMSINPNPVISGYMAQVDAERQRFDDYEYVYLPVPLTSGLQPAPDTTCEERITKVNSCLRYDPERRIAFDDVPETHWASRHINLLKNTVIEPHGDYVFSGIGNHSTGRQQMHFQSGVFSFAPERTATRLEVVKTALVANCIPILDEIPLTTVQFSDVSSRLTGDDVQDFVSRVFYTAALYDIVTGYEDGSARPYEQATKLETLAILLRAANAVPVAYSPSQLIFTDLPPGGWYDPYVSFAVRNGITLQRERTAFRPQANMFRSELSALLTRIMRYSGDLRVRAYRTGVDGLLK